MSVPGVLSTPCFMFPFVHAKFLRSLCATGKPRFVWAPPSAPSAPSGPRGELTQGEGGTEPFWVVPTECWITFRVAMTQARDSYPAKAEPRPGQWNLNFMHHALFFSHKRSLRGTNCTSLDMRLCMCTSPPPCKGTALSKHAGPSDRPFPDRSFRFPLMGPALSKHGDLSDVLVRGGGGGVCGQANSSHADVDNPPWVSTSSASTVSNCPAVGLITNTQRNCHAVSTLKCPKSRCKSRPVNAILHPLALGATMAPVQGLEVVELFSQACLPQLFRVY